MFNEQIKKCANARHSRASQITGEGPGNSMS